MSDEKLISLELLSRYHNNAVNMLNEGFVWRGTTAPAESKYTVWIDESATPAVLKYKNALGGWNVLASGGASTNNAEFNVANKTGWLSKTIAYGAECKLLLEWSSIEDDIPTGNGIVSVSVGGKVQSTYEEEQGAISVDIDNYLLLGKNSIVVSVSDIYGNKRDINFTVETVKVSIDSYFDSSVAYSGAISYPYTPTGAVEKTVHFILDGKEIDTQIVSVSGREQAFTIPAQAHGHHTFEVYFTCDIGDQKDIPSNHLYYDLICIEEGNGAPIIATAFNTESVKQFATVTIPYIVYTPEMLSSAIRYEVNGIEGEPLTVDRTVQTWSYKAENVGTMALAIVCGEVRREISFDVEENKIDVQAETSGLELYLASKGRSNNEENPLTWSYNGIGAQFEGVNLTNGGWQTDKNGDVVFRVTGEARVYIPFNIFGADFKNGGKTVEFEFATKDVLNYDATVISCTDGSTGINVTAQKALFKFNGGELSTQYKEDEHIRVSFTIEPSGSTRLIRIYINGIMSGFMQYDKESATFEQASPVGISIGSSECTTDIYCIRIYNNNLSQYQVLDNWIADTQDVEEMISRYNRNNIFDDYGNVAVDKLPKTLPYLVLEAESYEYLPQYKGDKERPVNGYYVDPLHSERSFTFNQAQIDVQGTSSQYYARKNYKIKFKNGFIVDGVTQAKYKLRDTSMPTDEFTFKADVASSEGVNNVELCKLYDDVCPVRTPPQESDSRVRQGIEGYPILVFYYDGSYYNFLGKYNFNNDKATSEVFGLDDNDESWEILLNNTDLAKFKSTDFSEWTKTFEARHPEDNTDISKLQALTEWINSTDEAAAITDEEKAARLQKFRDELSIWFNVDMLIFNYIFTELFLLVDNRAKNAFPTRYDEDGKWIILPYDYDTAIGTNNEGKLQFGYQFEDTDFIRGTELITAEQAEEQGIDVETDDTVDYTYNGQDSVLYVNLRKCFSEEIKAMYQQLRSEGKLSYEEVERRFSGHQNVWGEAVFNEDSRFKYIEPYINEGDSTYVNMLQGSKAEQRKWWLYNRFRYLDSKYNTGDAKADYINLKAFAKSDITLVPYADIYATADFDSITKQTRAFRGKTCVIENPADSAQGQVISIFSAPQIAEIGDLSGFDLGLANFSKATRLSGRLKIGDSERINAKLSELTIGNLTLLSELNVMNCTALTQNVDVSGCTNIEHLYFEGTSITGVTLPNGGILKTLHLPSTVTSLIIRNQPLLNDFSMPSYENLTTLRLENLNVNLFDTLEMILQMPKNSRVRVLGVDWTVDTAEEIFETFDKLDSYKGLDEYGNTLDKVQISGVIHTGTITSADLAEMKRRYPNFTIDYEHITSEVNFYNYDGTKLCDTVIVRDNGNCPDPIAAGDIATPTKPETSESKFIYAGWSESLENVTENRDIYAVFNEYTKYVVTFISDGAVHFRKSYTNFERIEIPESPAKQSTAQYDYSFKGWSIDGVNVVDVADYTDENLTYYAVFEASVRSYVVTWIVGELTETTVCEYGSTPIPPSDFEVGKQLVVGDRIYAVNAWNVSTVTGNATYTAVAAVIRSGSVTATLTKAGAVESRSASTALSKTVSRFLDGSGSLAGGNPYYTDSAVFYGFNFEALRNLKNLNITGFSLNMVAGRYSSGSANSTEILFRFISDFNTSGTNADTFTAISNRYTLVSGDVQPTAIVKTHSDFPEVLTWMKDNPDKVINGYNSNSFGVWFEMTYAQIRTGLTLTLTYTYEE